MTSQKPLMVIELLQNIFVRSDDVRDLLFLPYVDAYGGWIFSEIAMRWEHLLFISKGLNLLMVIPL